MHVSATQLEVVEGEHNKYYRGYVLDAGSQWGAVYQWGRRGTTGQVSKTETHPSLSSARWARDEQLGEKEWKKGYESVGSVSFDVTLALSADKQTVREVLDPAFLAAWSAESDTALAALLQSRTTEAGAPVVLALRGLAERSRSQPWAGAAREAVSALVHADTPASREVVGVARHRAGLVGAGRYKPIGAEEDLVLVLADTTTAAWLARHARDAVVPVGPASERDDANVLGIALGLAGQGAGPRELAQALEDARLCMS